ncbi:MAG: alpha/beta fold hydrolase [Trueperaceae bacterium]|nr:MAG: alpha/beta fold hydrolase [Trueperaceae bacterium]
MLFWIVFSLAITVLALVLVGWHFSNHILVPKPYTLMPEFEVLEAGDGTVTLPLPSRKEQFADTLRTGVYNLLWQGGYGRLGEMLEQGDHRVVRKLEIVCGRPPQTGDAARIDITVFRRDPWQDHEIPFEDLSLSGESGLLRAWWVDQGAETAVLMLHGRRRADRTETLRAMPVVVETGLSVLSLAYRNHDQSDPCSSGFYRYGAGEYRDVLTAVEFLTEHGVRHIVIYGFSMGGAVALEALKRWPATLAQPLALIFDSPLLDPRTVFKQGARAMGMGIFSHPLIELVLLVGGRRAKLNWSALDQPQSAAEITVPVLLVAGTADQTIPIHLIDRFAERLQAPLSYRRLEGVDHVEAWNSDPEAYQGWLKTFLNDVLSVLPAA